MKGTDEQIYAMSDKERNNRKAGVLIQCILEELKTKYSQLYRAFSVFDVVPTDDDIVLATDGRNIYFHAMNLSTKLGEYGSKGYKYMEHTLLHICLHCVLGHLWESQAYSNKSAIGAILDRQAEEIVLMLCNEKQEWDRCDSYFDLTRDKKGFWNMLRFILMIIAIGKRSQETKRIPKIRRNPILFWQVGMRLGKSLEIMVRYTKWKPCVITVTVNRITQSC